MNFTFINMSECGPFVAIRNDTGTTDGCYVSSLKFIASSPAIFNNTSVECLDGDGKEIGIDIVKIAGDYDLCMCMIKLLHVCAYLCMRGHVYVCCVCACVCVCMYVCVSVHV